jgi:GNAT superfamily N-acetyltransferase
VSAHEGVSRAGRSRVRTRTARPGDLPAVLSLVRQHHADATYECALTGQGPGSAAATGFRRLLSDPAHRVVLAVLPGPNAHGGQYGSEEPVGLAVLGTDPLSVVLGSPQVTIDWFVVHRDHRRRGTGAALLAAAAAHAAETGADHVVAAVGGHEAERQRFFSRMGFAPLATRRIVGREQLVRQLSAWQRNGLAVPSPRRAPQRRRPVRPLTGVLGDLSVAEG